MKNNMKIIPLSYLKKEQDIEAYAGEILLNKGLFSAAARKWAAEIKLNEHNSIEIDLAIDLLIKALACDSARESTKRIIARWMAEENLSPEQE